MTGEASLPGFLLVVTVVGAVAFGPLAPGIVLPGESDESVRPGTGSANVTVTESPDQLRLEAGSFGDGMYHLRSNQVLAEVGDVEGNPIVGYNIYVPALGLDKQSYRVLSPGANRAIALTQESATFPRDEVTKDEYQATITVIVRGADGKRVVIEKRIPVVVE